MDLSSVPEKRLPADPGQMMPRRHTVPPSSGHPCALRGCLLVIAGLVAVALIALLDLATGPYLACSIFYLMPVAACAWWGGFAPGVLIAIASSIAWHWTEHLENPMIPMEASLWNGCVRFCSLTLVASLAARLHAGVLRERRLARTDPLTGAANARTFYETAVLEVERARRTGRPFTLAYFDLDNFKQLNDRLGHSAGDAALIHVVQTIQSHLRANDVLTRIGGDEFALLLPEQGPEGALALLNRLQTLLSHEMARHGWPVSLSIGAVTFLSAAWDVDVIIRRADVLMYNAKRRGKGCVEHAVIREPQPRPVERQDLERRATTRLLCSCPARVRLEEASEVQEEPATVCDISAGGLGLYLEREFPLDTILIVEPLCPGARTLLARVVRVTREDRNWLHGCILPTRMSAEELGGWLGAIEPFPDRPVDAPGTNISVPSAAL
jgi:diguanylate cyclase (GGDEF)-like protein